MHSTAAVLLQRTVLPLYYCSVVCYALDCRCTIAAYCTTAVLLQRSVLCTRLPLYYCSVLYCRCTIAARLVPNVDITPNCLQYDRRNNCRCTIAAYCTAAVLLQRGWHPMLTSRQTVFNTIDATTS